MKFSLVVLAATAASASPLSVGTSTTGLTGALGTLAGQLAQLTQLPTCAVSCINASAAKAGTGSLTPAQLGKLCGNVTGMLNGAAVCLAACKLPVAQATLVTPTLKSVCAAVKL